MLEKLKQEVLEANLALPAHGLVTFTWGNVSGIDREEGLVVRITGAKNDVFHEVEFVAVHVKDRIIVEQVISTSYATAHINILYKAFPDIGGVVHTHSPWATSWAQAERSIPALGTTHADYYYGDIPVTRRLTQQEITEAYELETGNVIIETFTKNNIDPVAMPGILVAGHAPFCWGKNADEAVHNAVVLEEVAKMALHTLQLNPQIDF